MLKLHLMSPVKHVFTSDGKQVGGGETGGSVWERGGSSGSMGHKTGLSTPLWCLSCLLKVVSFEDLSEGQVLGVATTGKFLREQGEVVPIAEWRAVLLSLLH